MSSTMARSINKIPSLGRFLILFLVIIVLIHLFSLDIIQSINTNTNKSEVKASLNLPNAKMEEKTSCHQQDRRARRSVQKPFENLSKPQADKIPSDHFPNPKTIHVCFGDLRRPKWLNYRNLNDQKSSF